MLFILKRYMFMKGTPGALKVLAVITVGGIALAVSVLVVSISVATGFERSYKSSILDFNAHVVMLSEAGELSGYGELARKLALFGGVRSVTPFIYRESMIAGKGVVKGVVIKGLDLQRISDTSRISIRYFEDEPSSARSSAAVIGRALAEKFGIDAPTDINLLIGGNRSEKRHVAGVFESGLYDYDSQFVLMPLHDVQKLFGMRDEVTGIEMKLDDPDDAFQMKELLRAEFDYPYAFTTWEELNKPIFEAVRLEKLMFALIVGVLVLVGMFNIIGTIVLRIIYKLRDVSILSAIGMGPDLLRGIFTFHGTVLGVIGTVSGLGAGSALAYLIGRLKLVSIEPEIYFLSNLPVSLDWHVLALIGIAGTVVSFAVSFAASTRVSALGIVEGLRG